MSDETAQHDVDGQPSDIASLEGELEALLDDLDDEWIPTKSPHTPAYHKSGKKFIYKKITLHLDKDIVALLRGIKKKTLLNHNMVLRPLTNMLHHIVASLMECTTERDVETALRRHYHLY